MTPPPAAPAAPAANPPDQGDSKGKKRGLLVLLLLLLPILLPLIFLSLGMAVAVIHDLLRDPNEKGNLTAGIEPGDSSDPNDPAGATSSPKMSVKRPPPDLVDTIPRINPRFNDSPGQRTYILKDKDGAGSKPVNPLNLSPAERDRLTWVVPQPTPQFGLTTASDPKKPSAIKKLNFSEVGKTNNTVFKIDGQDFIYGLRPPNGKDGQEVQQVEGGYLLPGRWNGHWKVKQEELGSVKSTVGWDRKEQQRKRPGRRSIWVFDPNIEVSQTVEIIPGPQSRVLDTMLVTYVIVNNDDKDHEIGVRFLMDTFIGSNDGVPFTIPGKNELCDTMMEFNSSGEVPDFISALENQDLSKPGTVVQVHLHASSDTLESPNKVTLGCWPNMALGSQDARCREDFTMWDVPVLPIRQIQSLSSNAPPDSAVTMYWDPKPMKPGETRTIGFAYGLGQVAADDPGNKDDPNSKGSGSDKGPRRRGNRLGLSVGGTLVKGYTFTVTALVNSASDGERVELILPEGLELAQGDTTQDVPRAQAGRNSPVSWRVKAREAGVKEIKAKLSTGASQKLAIEIRKEGIASGAGR